MVGDRHQNVADQHGFGADADSDAYRDAYTDTDSNSRLADAGQHVHPT
jgi:hypothetical protein